MFGISVTLATKTKIKTRHGTGMLDAVHHKSLDKPRDMHKLLDR